MLFKTLQKSLGVLFGLWGVWVASGANPPAGETLHIEFDKVKTIKCAGENVKLDGTFTPDGFWRYGKKGMAIPTKGLLGEAGTVFFRFKQGDFTEPKMKMRYLLTARNAGIGRFALSIYTGLASNGKLFVGFADYSPDGNQYFFGSTDHLKLNEPVAAAVTWNGDRVRVYKNGVMQEEVKQPLPFPSDTFNKVFIGPYVDGTFNPDPWGDDSFAGTLRLFSRELTPDEIAAISDVKLATPAELTPPMLTIPEINAADLTMDGKLSEKFWSAAASMPSLVDASRPNKGWTLPASSFRLAYDQKNIYLGFSTRFPDMPADAIREGEKRSEAREPEVWGSESFEFYLKKGKDVYRFGGNVAGGYCESLNGNGAWKCDWQYVSHIGMQIDNSRLWQGEAAIPWSALGLDAPPQERLAFNFGRSWFLPEIGTWSSILEDGEYQKYDRFVPLVCGKNVPVARVLRQGVPDFGRMEQEIEFFSPVDTTVTYKVDAANSNGTVIPYLVAEQQMKLTAGVPAIAVLPITLERGGFDRLLFTLTAADGKVLMRQIAPFALNEQFAEVKKLFTQSKIMAVLRQEQMRAKFGAKLAPEVRILAPDGRLLLRKAAGNAKEVELPFDRSNPRGDYKFEVADADGKMIYTSVFFYPGLGEWDNVKPDNRIIPPFTALQTKKLANGIEVLPWGRTYQWNGTIFPSAITAQERSLLKAPVAFSVNGQEYSAGNFMLGTTALHRDDYKLELRQADFTLSGDGWIEYDGVTYQTLKLRAKHDLNNVAIKMTLPASLAKYLHTAAGVSSWGQKLTEKIKEGRRVFPWYPVIFVGDEEGGLCFFTETRKNWTHPAATCCCLVKDNKQAVLEIRIADQLESGQVLPLEFGFVATPVKPLPENYPLDIFGDNYVATMNRPGRRPTNDPMLTFISFQYEISECFWDLPTPETSVQAQMGYESAKRILSCGSRPIPYHQSRYLSDEYPEVSAYLDEWRIMPNTTLDYTRGTTRHKLHDCCPRTAAADYYVCKFKEMLGRYPELRGIYFDFGIVSTCSNLTHGCDNRLPLLGLRDFYRKICLAQLDAGIEKPLVVLHNTDAVQIPGFTFATHLFNGEQLRQHSSTMLHNGRDILDNYDETMFACELSSLPFGITNSDYHAQDNLLPEFGGGKEDPELYKFRLTLAMLAGALPHNTIPSSSRLHFGLYDKLVRIYDEFNVPKAKFAGYWHQPAEVLEGKNVFVSVYRHATEPRVLAVISHIGKEHIKQKVKIRFSPGATGLASIKSAVEAFTKDDPDYSYLKHELITPFGHTPDRAPLKLGDFGVKVLDWNGIELKLELDFHKVALVELR